MNFPKDKFIISYIGGVTPERGLDTVIKALAHLGPLCLPLKLYIIGAEDSNYVSSLKKLVFDLSLSDVLILFHGFPFRRFLSLFKCLQYAPSRIYLIHIPIILFLLTLSIFVNV